jgi:hypothetical protein
MRARKRRARRYRCGEGLIPNLRHQESFVNRVTPHPARLGSDVLSPGSKLYLGSWCVLRQWPCQLPVDR